MKKWPLLLSFLLCACSSLNKDQSIEPPQLSDSDYVHLLEAHSKSNSEYDGFNNVFNISATLLNSKVNGAVIDRLRYFKQLNVPETQKLREKSLQEMSTETHFFVSYFSPTSSLKYLDRGDALWKIYLEVGGRRYEAQVSKYPGLHLETKSLFPSFTRWSRAYILKFKIPTSVAEAKPLKLIFTSSAGNAIFNFSASTL